MPTKNHDPKWKKNLRSVQSKFDEFIKLAYVDADYPPMPESVKSEMKKVFYGATIATIETIAKALHEGITEDELPELLVRITEEAREYALSELGGIPENLQ